MSVTSRPAKLREESTGGSGTIGVSIVGRQAWTREGLRRLIDGSPGFRCHGCFRDAGEAASAARKAPPDLFLIDLDLSGRSGCAGVRTLVERAPGAVVLALSAYGDDERIPEAVLQGACGHLSKMAPPAQLLGELHDAARGRARCSPEIARRILDVGCPGFSWEEPRSIEGRLLAALAEGHVEETAAEALGISTEEAGRTVRQIFDGVHRWIHRAAVLAGGGGT
jgi:DNA-binding NarL/FixJ family response regulator